MGGSNFYSDHKDCIRRRYCNELKGGKYSVDFIYQLYKKMIGIKNKKRTNERKIHEYIDINLVDPDNTKPLEKLIEYEDKVAHLIATCSFTGACAEKNIFPILVFDGKPPLLKRKKLEERKKNRDRANEECSKILDKTSNDYIRQHKRCVELRDIHFKETFELIRAMGLVAVQSPGEADPQCAAIATCLSDVDAVIGEDSDIILFGGNIIKNFDRKNSTVNTIKLQDILESLKNKANKILKSKQKSEINEFKDEYFIDLRIISGTDYNDPISGINRNDLFELFVLKNFNVPKLIKNIKNINISRNAVIIPDNYENNFNKIKQQFQDKFTPIDLMSLKNKTNIILKNNQRPEINEFDDEYYINTQILLNEAEKINGISQNELFELFVLKKFNISKLINKLKKINVLKSAIIIPDNFEEKWRQVKKYYTEAEVIDPMTIDTSIKLPNLEKMIDILHKKNKFNIKFVKKLHSQLMHNYNLYYNIPFDTNWYNSFRSYQIKFHNTKIKNNHQSQNLRNNNNNKFKISKSDKLLIYTH